MSESMADSWETQLHMTFDQAIGNEQLNTAEVQQREKQRTYTSTLLLDTVNTIIDATSVHGYTLDHRHMYSEI